jgi:outer membrane protein OmpA-like peptidoglycan-associated protein
MQNKKVTEITKTTDGWGGSSERKVEYETQGEFDKYVHQNLLKVLGALSTLIGVITIYAYHFHIDYFPVFDLNSSASMVLAAAYVGLCLFSIFGFFILFPAICIGAFRIDDIADKKKHPEVIRWLLVSFAIAGVGFIVLFFAAFYLSDKKYPLLWILIFIPIIILITLLLKGRFLKFIVFRRKLKLLTRKENKRAVLYGILLAAICFLEFTPIFAYLLVMQGAPTAAYAEASGIDLAPPIIAVSVFIQMAGVYFVVAWFFPEQSLKHKTLSLLLVIVFGIFAAMFAKNPGFFWVHTARITKIGNFYASEITLTENGCNVTNSKGSLVCTKVDSSGYKICGAYILSRIGSETYFKVFAPSVNGAANSIDQSSLADKNKNKEKKGAIKDVLLPSKDILGMKVDAKRIFPNISAAEVELLAEQISCEVVENLKVIKTITLNENEFFEFDQYRLSISGQEALTKIAQKLRLREPKHLSINIIGHADQIGSERYNMFLSQMRALSIENYMRNLMRSHGDTKISSQGVGSTRVTKTDLDCPKSMDITARKVCLATNRRVEIVISGS